MGTTTLSEVMAEEAKTRIFAARSGEQLRRASPEKAGECRQGDKERVAREVSVELMH